MKKLTIVYFESNLGFHCITDLVFPKLPSYDVLKAIIEDYCDDDANVYAECFYLNENGNNNYYCSIYGSKHSFKASHVSYAESTIQFANDGRSVFFRAEL